MRPLILFAAMALALPATAQGALPVPAQRALPVTARSVLAVSAPPAMSAMLSAGMAAYRAGDYVAARKIFVTLAEDDSAIAETMLGTLYARGLGVQANPATATTYYFRAAQRGYAPAQLAFARSLATGSGISRDRKSAWVWAQLAGRRGDARVAAAASALLPELETGLTDEDHAQLESRLTGWRPWATGRD